jgi:hypothetical protein
VLPLYGWNRVLKRGVDLAVGAAALIIAQPVMAIAVAVALTPRGTIFYRQERRHRAIPAARRWGRCCAGGASKSFPSSSTCAPA